MTLPALLVVALIEHEEKNMNDEKIITPVGRHCPHGFPLYYKPAPEVGAGYIQAFVGTERSGRHCCFCGLNAKSGVPFRFYGYPPPRAEEALTTDSEEESHDQ